MKERPIIFSGPMVRAILEGRKTQAKRVIKHRYEWYMGENYKNKTWPYFYDYVYAEPEPTAMLCPYGKPGDRLWGREAWQDTRSPGEPENQRQIMYRADDGKWSWDGNPWVWVIAFKRIDAND